MAKILYVARKDGMAGFIKLVETSSCREGEIFLHGPEIHFRRMKVKIAENFKSSTSNIDTGKSPDLKLLIKDRKLRLSFVQFAEVCQGNLKDMQAKWQELLIRAKQINQRENLLDPEHYTTCCHTLAFEVLEGAGLCAPREQFLKQRSLKGFDPPKLQAS